MSVHICNLCLKEKANMKAHILAEGLLRQLGLIDGQVQDTSEIIVVGAVPHGKLRRPSGSYDKELLCRECDQKLGLYDNEAIKLVRDYKLINHPSGKGFIVKNINQELLRLFFISFIWRASLTHLTEFSNFSVGSKHEERMREILLAGKIDNLGDYATHLTKFSLPVGSEWIGQHILLPVNTRLEKLRHIDVYLPGIYKAKVKVDSQRLAKLELFCVGSSEDLFVFDAGDLRKSEEFKILLNMVNKK